MIAVGWNSKLGEGIASFSLQAGSTCPGASAFCASACYAKKGFIMFPQNQARYAKNFAESLTDNFVDKLVEEIHTAGVRTVRIHPSGDFYSIEYVRAWTQAAKRLPWVRFFGYTRSWRIPSFMPALEELRALPNVVIYASMDDSMHDKLPEGWPVAFTGDIAVIYGTLCPNQTSGGKVTCAQCRHCIEGNGDVTFLKH